MDDRLLEDEDKRAMDDRLLEDERGDEPGMMRPGRMR
jgi:hypothetical protein